MNDRLSRSSMIMSPGAPNSPIKSIISRIKLISSGYDVQEFDPYNPFNTDTHVEQILINRQIYKVRKVYLVACPEYKVGWVVDCDLPICMICFGKFGWRRYRHHCRSCGSLVCGKCSPFKTSIPRLFEESGSRVCKNCFGLRPSPAVSPANASSSQLFDNQSQSGDNASSVGTPTSYSIRRRGTGKPKETSERQKYEEELQKFEAEQLANYESSYRMMREVLPIDISKTNMKRMVQQGLPTELAQRFWDTRVLWLICMHPDDMSKVHIADLRSKYQAYGLDIVEMRALWYCLRQANWQNGSEAMIPKAEWTAGIKSKLDDLTHKEAYGKLTESERRNPAYKQAKKLFDPTVPIECRYARSASYFKDAEATPDHSPRPHNSLAPGYGGGRSGGGVESTPTDSEFYGDLSSMSFDLNKDSFLTPSSTDLYNNGVTLMTDDIDDMTTPPSTREHQSQSLEITPPELVTPAITVTPKNVNRISVGSSARNLPFAPNSIIKPRVLGNTPDIDKSSFDNAASQSRRTHTQFPVSAGLKRPQSSTGSVALLSTSTRTRVPFPVDRESISSRYSKRASNSFSSQFSDGSVASSLTNNPARSFGKFLSLAVAGRATSAKGLLNSDQAPQITPQEATILLLRCADDPDSLAEPLDTFRLLIEVLGADPNATDSSGRNLIQTLFTNPFIGGYLLAHGADILEDDNAGWCALSMSFEYGVEWMYEAFLSSGKEALLLESGNQAKILRYVSSLIIGGYGTRAAEILATKIVSIDADLASELFNSCSGNFDNMKEPVETFELLEKLGARLAK